MKGCGAEMVYLLHFSQPYKHARHYVGWSATRRTLRLRLEHHRSGSGARLMQVVARAGIGFELARVWKRGDRTFERRVKNRKEAPRLCPICSGDRALGRLRRVQVMKARTDGQPVFG